MRLTSERMSEEQFNERGNRYCRAMEAVPDARRLEFAPYPLLLHRALAGRDPSGLLAADVLCGSGPLTRALGGVFRRIVGLDISAEMLSHYPVGEQVEAMRVPLSKQQALLEALRPDVILGVAGMHHVFVVEDGELDPAASTEFQVMTLCSWASSLAPGGVLLIADGTHRAVDASFTDDARPLGRPTTALGERYAALTRWGDVGHDGSGWPDSLAGHRDAVLTLAPVTPAHGPARWFGDFVNTHGIYGHSDHFLFPREIVDGVRKRGLVIEYFELPTPWLFPSLDALAFYFHELFCLGPPAHGIGEVAPAARARILQWVEEGLGLHALRNGSFATGWRLGYYTLRR